MNTHLVKIFLKILRGGKCVCLETLRREWKEFQKGGGYHEGKDRCTQTTLFNLYSKSLIGKLRYVNDVKLTKEAKLRLKWIEYYEKVKDVTKTCRYFGISRNTFYKWLKRYQKDGLKGLLDRPKTPLRK
jgi:hypothetical protein